MPTAVVLKKGSVQNGSVQNGSVQVEATVLLDASGEKATLRPARALKRGAHLYGAIYTVTVTSAATGAAGNALVHDLDHDPRGSPASSRRRGGSRSRGSASRWQDRGFRRRPRREGAE